MPWRSALAGLLIAAAGLITLVGSGGGMGVGCLFCTPGEPLPWLEVSVIGPPVVQVGETATFYSYTSGGYLGQPPNTYRWCRSPGGAAPCVEIAGATGTRGSTTRAPTGPTTGPSSR